MPISFLLLLFDVRRVVCWQVLGRVPLSHSKLLPWWLTKLARDNSWEGGGGDRSHRATDRPTDRRRRDRPHMWSLSPRPPLVGPNPTSAEAPNELGDTCEREERGGRGKRELEVATAVVEGFR